MLANIREIFSVTLQFFNGGMVILWNALYAFLSGAYFYIISLNLTLSIFMGLLLAFPLFYVLNVMTEERNYRVRELNAISKYVQVLVFNLKVGKNILHAYEATLPLTDPLLHNDLERTIDALKYKGTLEVDHFKKYNFKVLNLFHNNLSIKATKGGIATDIFKHTTKDLTMELSRRDELGRTKGFIVGETYMMLAMSMSVPVLLSYTAKMVYIPFVESQIGQPFLVCYVLFTYFVIYSMSKCRLDVDVTI